MKTPDAFALVFLDLTTAAGVRALRGMGEKLPPEGFPTVERAMPKEGCANVAAEPPAADIDA